MNTFKIDGRRNFNVAELNNGGTVEASKYHGMYSVKVINSDRLVIAELASLVSKEEAQEIVNDYLASDKEDSVTIVTNEEAVNEPTNKGEWGRFEIDNESQLQEVDYNLNEYSYHSQIENQFFETVKFYVPDDEMDTVLAVINGKKYETNFYDCDDFTKESDYLPVTFNNKVYFYYSYFYASKEYYYPTK